MTRPYLYLNHLNKEHASVDSSTSKWLAQAVEFPRQTRRSFSSTTPCVQYSEAKYLLKKKEKKKEERIAWYITRTPTFRSNRYSSPSVSFPPIQCLLRIWSTSIYWNTNNSAKSSNFFLPWRMFSKFNVVRAKKQDAESVLSKDL